MSVNACIKPGCNEIVSSNKAACPSCWKQVPKPLKDALWDAFRRGNMMASLQHLWETVGYFLDDDQDQMDQFAKWLWQCDVAQLRPEYMKDLEKTWERCKVENPKVAAPYLAKAELIVGEFPGSQKTEPKGTE